ncbi:ISL3 family transposase, partial [Vibrio splendidus]
ETSEMGWLYLQFNYATKPPYLQGIIASASYSLNICTLEGINNKIKLMGYGYRDTDYFFLKIKAAFLRKPR